MNNLPDDKNIDMLFVGGMYEKEREVEYLRNSPDGIQNAVNSQQWNLVDGFRSINGIKLQAVTAPFLASYPKYKKIVIKCSNDNIINVGYTNLPIIRNFSRYFRLRDNIKKWTDDTCEDKIVICYYLSIPHMLAIVSTKMEYATRILVIPDLPDFLSFSKSMPFLKKLNYAIKRLIIKHIISKFDKYIVLTKYMAERLQLKDGTWIVSEGMVSKEDILPEKVIRNRKFLNNDVVYSGGMHVDYDVDNLLEAIHLIDEKDIDFYFYGTGELSEKIKSVSKIDNRVHFMGFCNRGEVLDRQRSAKILINPRGNGHEYVKYSFPSKNLEYLSSGTPVLACKLSCTPDDYDEHFYYMINNTPEQIAKSILDIKRTPEPELVKKGVSAANFIIKNKLNLVECRRLLRFFTNTVSATDGSKMIRNSLNFTRGKEAILNLIAGHKLISAVMAYLLITLLLYVAGPMQYDHDHLGSVIIIVLIYNIALLVGYIFAERISKRDKSIPEHSNNEKISIYKKDELVKKFVLLFSIINVILIYALLGLMINTFNPIDIINYFIHCLFGIGEAYKANILQGMAEVSGTALVTKVAFLLSPLIYLSLVMGVYFFGKLGRLSKAAFIVSCLMVVMQTVFKGQNIGIFNVLILIIGTITVKKTLLHKKDNSVGGKYKSRRTIAVLILAAVALLFMYFSMTMIGRLGTTEETNSFFHVRVDQNNWVLAALPKPIKNPVLMGVVYISSGYRGLEYSLDYDFTSTYGLGSGYFQLGLAKDLGVDLSARTYQYKMRDSWDPKINWHTAYVWFANDISLFGVPILMTLLGFMLYIVLWECKKGNLFAIAAMPLYLSIIIFLPCNNLILGNAASCWQFIAINLLLVLSILKKDLIIKNINKISCRL